MMFIAIIKIAVDTIIITTTIEAVEAINIIIKTMKN